MFREDRKAGSKSLPERLERRNRPTSAWNARFMVARPKGCDHETSRNHRFESRAYKIAAEGRHRHEQRLNRENLRDQIQDSAAGDRHASRLRDRGIRPTWSAARSTSRSAA